MIYFKSRVCTYLGHLKLPSTHCSVRYCWTAPLHLPLMHICLSALLDLKHLALREMMASLPVFSWALYTPLVYWLTVLGIACVHIFFNPSIVYLPYIYELSLWIGWEWFFGSYRFLGVLLGATCYCWLLYKLYAYLLMLSDICYLVVPVLPNFHLLFLMLGVVLV